ncbi:ABC transporter permease [Paenibacillus macerans]|uniref:ABC transporter permease n=1 Tax=Paenibacillus macerans TaxID=44252 RepID=UPI00203C813D|nr:ABC transporter permease [Paenibacillus macerans]MCM3698829.1 ABC transporter permease [Paenibacillus macerans]
MSTKNSALTAMLKGNIGIIFVLLILCVVLSIVSPVFLTTENLITVLRQVSNNVFLALGMTLVMILGGIDLSVGAIVAVSGTLTVGFMVNNGIPMPVAILLGVVIGTLLGFFNGVIITQFKLPAFIVTLATMNIAQGIAYIYSGGRSARITNDAYTQLGTGKLFGFLPLPVLYMVILIIIFIVLLNKTKFGTNIFAIGGNREAARLSGVRIKKVEIAVYTLAGLLSALAGIVLSARMYSGQPSVGQGYEMDAIAACVLGGVSMAGGRGRISGTIFGVMIIGVVSNGLNLMGVSSFWQLLVKGLIILIAVLIDAQKGKKLPFSFKFAK